VNAKVIHSTLWNPQAVFGVHALKCKVLTKKSHVADICAIRTNVDFKEKTHVFWTFSSVTFVTCWFFCLIVKGFGKNPLTKVPTCWHNRGMRASG